VPADALVEECEVARGPRARHATGWTGARTTFAPQALISAKILLSQ